MTGVEMERGLYMRIIFVCVYYVIALISALILLKAYKRNTPLSIKIGNYMIVNFMLTAFYSINLITDNFLWMSIGSSISFLLLDIAMFAFLDFVITFIGYEKTFPKAVKVILAVAMMADGVSLILNPLTNHAVDFIKVQFYDAYVLELIPKWPYHFHIILLISIVMVIVSLLVIKCVETPIVYWKRYYGFLFCVLAGVFTNLFFMVRFLSLKIDMSVIIYVIIGILMYFNTFHYMPLITSKITRRVILYYINDPLVLFDYEGKLAEYNIYVNSLFPDIDFSVGNLMIDEFIGKGKFPRLLGTEKKQEFEWKVRVDDQTRVFQCRFKCIRDGKGRMIGRLFIFHDITSLKKAYFELEQSLIFDSLTGFFNKRSFFHQIPQWDDERYWPISVAVCNINGLRAINEYYGTKCGDEIFRKLAEVIRHYIREEVYVAKIDDGDIVIMFENTNQVEAAEILELIKNCMIEDSTEIPVYVEYGISVKDSSEMTVEKVLLDAKNSMLNKKMLKDNSASRSLVDSLKQTLSESDYETEEHVERTREMAFRLGNAMKLSDSEVGKLELLAVLHDIGKVAIPHDVLSKKESLTDDERKIIQEHTIKGFRIAKSSPELSDIAECILSHHEKWDGSGYPNKLVGEQIPLLSRIISVVDSYDVMTHDRPYHVAMSVEESIRELRKCSGTQFDPKIIDVFIKMIEEG